MGEALEIIPETSTLNSEVYLSRSYDLHANFNKEKWQNKESFHNEKHIEAVVKCSDILIDAAKEGDDPLNLQEDLEKWNQMNPDVQIYSLEEFQKVAEMAFAAHDWGNIMEDLEVVDGEIQPQYHKGYKALGAEDRSKAMLEKVVNADNDLIPEDKERYLRLAQHLIEQTKFIFDDRNGELSAKDDVPFAKFMMVVDQIGNGFFSKNDQRIDGLNEEIANEFPDRMIELRKHYDFVHGRFPVLIPDESDRNEILRVMGQEMPPTHPDITKTPLRAADLVRATRLIKEVGIVEAERRFKTDDGKNLSDFIPMRDWDTIATKEGIKLPRVVSSKDLQ